MEHSFDITDNSVYKSLTKKHLDDDFTTVEKSDSGDSKSSYMSQTDKLFFENDLSEKVVSVFDVACYVLSQLNEKSCTTMKLHKLLYYCQAWSMAWVEKPLFQEKIEAWANGPVVKELFYLRKGYYTVHYNDITVGNENLLSSEQKGVIDDVLGFYGNKDPQWLIELTHSEKPWYEARKGMQSNERGDREISLESMQLYYSSLK